MLPLFSRSSINGRLWSVRGERSTQSAWVVHPYGHFLSLLTPLLAILFLIGMAAFQLLPGFYGLTNATTALVALPDMTSPLLAHSRLYGLANEQQLIALSIGLRPHNQLRLHDYVQNISQKTSSSYQRFLTPRQYAATFSPSKNAYDTLCQFLQAEGFTVTHTYKHRLLLDFSGSIKLAEQVFHVTIHTYTGPDGHSYYANDGNPLLPAQFAHDIVAINGLNNALSWHPMRQSRRLLSPLPALPSVPSKCPGYNKDYLLPDQFASVYGLDKLYQAHYQGEGQTIALFELSPLMQSDISTYTDCFGHSHTKIQTITSGSTPTSNDGAMEAEMDSELILSAAPHLATLKVYESSNDTTSYLSQWAHIIQDAPPIVSTSWGLCEQTLDPALIKQEHTLFMAAAAQGQSIFASTGDTGSADCLSDTTRGTSKPGIDDPASQPFVISVGGTSLTLKGTASYGSETTWNTSQQPDKGYNGTSGGGISQYWTRPPWQRAIGIPGIYSTPTFCKAPAKNICRETPDVSLHANADKGYIIYCSAQATKKCNSNQPWNIVGGTSASTPLWAVLAALANQASLRQKGNKLGFIAPLLYQIARDSHKYHACFHDITTGNNDYNGLYHGRYPATTGYDMATGLGSYNAYALVNNLVELVQRKKKR